MASDHPSVTRVYHREFKHHAVGVVTDDPAPRERHVKVPRPGRQECLVASVVSMLELVKRAISAPAFRSNGSDMPLPITGRATRHLCGGLIVEIFLTDLCRQEHKESRR